LDPALWCINEQTRQYICKNGFSQNLDVKFTASKRLYSVVRKGHFRNYFRYLNIDFFKTVLINGETCQRDYLSYSESTGSIYCVPCLLFENKTHFSKVGFSDWKHPKKISYHENSPEHKLCSYKMKELASDSSKINTRLMYQIETEKKYWISVLTRVCSVVKSLASHGLSFRGDVEKFGSSTSNTGNFIMMMELLAEYDPLLSEHISKYGNPGKGNTSYLSFSTYEQFIKIMSEKVINTIVDEIKTSKYFSISIDSTPDISHTDQLSFVIRYVLSNGEPIERFIGFLENVGHKSENLAESVLSVLKKYNLDVCYLRGQSYDNAKNMSGIYSGVQARIKQVSPLADFVPCSAHSLNLVGSCAANCCKEANNFFLFIQNIFVFFSSSTHRWHKLSHYSITTIKSLSTTRWSAREDACHSLKKNWSSIKQVLEELINDDYEKPFVRSEARGLIRQMNKLETAYMTVFWSDILHTFNKTSLLLQSVNIDISTVVSLYNSLIEYVQQLRSMFNDYEKLAKTMFNNDDTVPDYEHKSRKRKKCNDESIEPDAIFNGRQNFKINTIYIICDNLIEELKKRRISYDSIISKYLFFLNISEKKTSEVRDGAKKLRKIYKNDLDETFENECVHFQSLLKTIKNPPTNIINMCKFIKEKNIEAIFPYVYVALRMFLCTPASNCSTERSFSTLRRIKTYLRSTMSSERLNSLAILNIESSITKTIDYSDIITSFASKQSRRKL